MIKVKLTFYWIVKSLLGIQLYHQMGIMLHLYVAVQTGKDSMSGTFQLAASSLFLRQQSKCQHRAGIQQTKS